MALRPSRSRRKLAQPTLFRRAVDGALTERQWQQEVEDALDFFGWWWMHVPANVVQCPNCHMRIYRGIRKGVPDLWAIRPPHMLYIELKRERGQLDPEQRRVGHMLEACGQRWIHARPRDRESLLKVIAHPEAA